MNLGDLLPFLNEIGKKLRIIETNLDRTNTVNFLFGTNADGNPLTLTGRKYLKVTKTNGTGTVTITINETATTLSSNGGTYTTPLLQFGLFPDIEIGISAGATYSYETF